MHVGLVADVHHHPPVAQLGDDAFHGMRRRITRPDNDRPPVPRVAVIVAVDHADGRRELLLARRKPDRHEQPAAVQLDAVARTGRLDDERVLGSKGRKRFRDFDGRRERPRVVRAAAIVGMRVIHAVEVMDHALSLPVDDQDAVVDGRFAGVDQHFHRAPCLAAVGAAPQDRVVVAVVPDILVARRGIGQQRPVQGHDHAGDAVRVIAALPRHEQVALLHATSAATAGARNDRAASDSASREVSAVVHATEFARIGLIPDRGRVSQRVVVLATYCLSISARAGQPLRRH